MIKIKVKPHKNSHQQLQTTGFGSLVITTDSVDGLPSGTLVLVLSEGLVPFTEKPRPKLIPWMNPYRQIRCRPLFKNEVIEITNE